MTKKLRIWVIIALASELTLLLIFLGRDGFYDVGFDKLNIAIFLGAIVCAILGITLLLIETIKSKKEAKKKLL